METNTRLAPDTVLSIAADQISCELSNEVVVLSLRNGEYFGLNTVAAAVWNLLQSPRSIEQVRDELLRQFGGITPDRCLQEVMTLVEELRAMELVEVH